MTRVFRILLLAGLVGPAADSLTPAQAQQHSTRGRYYPLNQSTPPGVAGRWSASIGKAAPAYFQQVRVELPTTGRVTFYGQRSEPPANVPAPGQAGLLVGPVYRLKLSELPEFPGVEFYPSVELIDRLHPPPGKADEFPVEIQFTEQELDWAVQGRMITKVIYLEQPQLVPLANLDEPVRVQTIPPQQNLIGEADLLGRPMVILRLGARTPDPQRPEPAFFGPGAPVHNPRQSPMPPKETPQAITDEPAADAK